MVSGKGGRGLTALLAVVLATAVLPTGAAGTELARPKTVRIPVGTYAGFVSWSAAFGGGAGVKIKSQGAGPLRIIASDSAVSGTWGWSGQGHGSLNQGSVGGSVDAVLGFGGIAKGTPAAPELDGTFTITGTFTATGDFAFTGPIDVSVDGSFPLDVNSATCQKIAGDFVPLFRENVEGANLALSGAAGKWVAIRVPTKIAADLQASLDTVTADLESMQAAFASGAPIDSVKLFDLLARVQLLAKHLPVDKACKVTKKTSEFSSFLAAYLGGLIGSALPRASSLSLDQLLDLAHAAHDIGLFPSSDPTIKALETGLRGAIDDKLTTAIAAGDSLGILTVETTAKQLGWKDLADRAAGALK